MKIATSSEGGVATLALDDRFDAYEVPAFRVAIEKLYGPGAVVRIDLAAIRFIDSTALAELLRSRTALQLVGGQLQLHPLSDPVRVILELTGLDMVFDIAAPAVPDRV